MAKGIELPIQIVNGRIKLLSGDDYIEQLILVALGECDSDNPFQDLGLGEFMIFAINAEAIEGEIRQKVRAIFSSFERDRLAKLPSASARSIRFEQKGEEKVMYLDYVNLETGERRELEVPLPPAGE